MLRNIAFLLLLSAVFAYETGEQYNLLIADNGISSVEEYRGDNFELLRRIGNDHLFGVTDVQIKNGYIFLASQWTYTIEVYSENTKEYVSTIFSYNDTKLGPNRLKWINNNQLAVILLENFGIGYYFPTTLSVLNVTFSSTVSALEHKRVVDNNDGFADLVQRDPSSIFVLTATGDIYTWDSDFTNTSALIFIDSTYFTNGHAYFIDWVDDTLWVVVHAEPQNTIWQISTQDFNYTISPSIKLEPGSFLVNGSDVLLFGTVATNINGFDFNDGRIYKYNTVSQTFSNFTNPENDPVFLGLLKGSTWDSSGNIVVADYSQLRFFDTNGNQTSTLTELKAFVEPRGITVCANEPATAYIVSMNRIMTFNLEEFAFVDDFVPSIFEYADGDYSIGNGIACDANSEIYLAAHKTLKFNSNGQLAFEFMTDYWGYNDSIGESQDIILDTHGDIWMAFGYTYMSQWSVSTDAWESQYNDFCGYIARMTFSSEYLFVVSDLTIYRFSLSSLSCAYDAFYPGPAQWDSILDIEYGPDGMVYALTLDGVMQLPSNLTNATRVTPARDTTWGGSITFVKATCKCNSDEKCVYGACVPEAVSHKKSGDSTPVIVGVVVGVGGFAAIVVGAAVGWKIRKSHQREGNRSDVELQKKSPDEEKTAPPEPAKRQTGTLFKSFDSHWEIDYKDLKIGEKIGAGAFGAVYHALYRNSDCVVKQMKESESKAAMDNFLKEAHTVIRVKPHKNLCFLFGVCTNPEYPTCIVMEYVNGGSLLSLLAEDKIQPTLKNMFRIFKDVASGMAHLHHEGLLHCDLACRNLLVSFEKGFEFTIKLADFGLARFSETGTYDASVNSVFPVRWSAPEVLKGSKLSKASDVWSFGVVMWEVIQGTVPYMPLTNQEVIEYVCVKRQILSAPTAVPDLPADVYDCMKSCWAFQAGNRPTFDGLFQTFADMEAEVLGETPNATPTQTQTAQQSPEHASYQATEHISSSNAYFSTDQYNTTQATSVAPFYADASQT